MVSNLLTLQQTHDMALPTEKDQSNASIQTAEEITQFYKSLPPTPSIEAISVVKTLNSEDQKILEEEEISNQAFPEDVTPELFSLVKQVKKKEAMLLVEVQKEIDRFDEQILGASDLVVSGDAHVEEMCNLQSPDGEITKEGLGDDKVRIRSEDPMENDAYCLLKLPSSESSLALSVKREEDQEKLSLMKMAAIIEDYAKAEIQVLDLQAKLMEQVEWIPLSLGKLLNLLELNLADNHIMALPSTIGNMKALKKLDFHGNQIINLPNSLAELLSLINLDVHANRLRTLPVSFGNLSNLTDLDLSSNQFTYLPDVIGDLTSLKRLNVENNELEELPYTIGSCSLLVELRLDFNQLTCLPNSLEKLQSLEILNVRYNRIKQLPITMGKLLHLKQLDVSYNELEDLPESLCFAANLRKLNVGKNFVDLKALPDSIGNLGMLEELDISYNQIKHLPDSFRLLVKLKVLHADMDLLQFPPRHIAELGPEAIVQYMTDSVAKKDVKSMIKNSRLFCLFACCFEIDI